MNELKKLGWEVEKSKEDRGTYYLSRHHLFGTDYAGVNANKGYISADADLSIDDMEAIIKFIKEKGDKQPK